MVAPAVNASLPLNVTTMFAAPTIGDFRYHISVLGCGPLELIEEPIFVNAVPP